MGEGKAGESYRNDSRKKDVRWDNLEAAKSVADAVRTSLGPRGMDKMVSRSVRVPSERKMDRWRSRGGGKRRTDAWQE